MTYFAGCLSLVPIPREWNEMTHNNVYPTAYSSIGYGTRMVRMTDIRCLSHVAYPSEWQEMAQYNRLSMLPIPPSCIRMAWLTYFVGCLSLVPIPREWYEMTHNNVYPAAYSPIRYGT